MPLDTYEPIDPEKLTSPEELKKQGNWHFGRAEYSDAQKNYERALSLLKEDWRSEERPSNIHQMPPEHKTLLSALLKNQAACLMKAELNDQGQAAIICCSRALAYTPNDMKALYRRVQALEQMNCISQAYSEARKMMQLFPKDKMVEKLCIKLRDIVQIKTMEDRSTEKRVNNMFDIISKKGALHSGDKNDLAKMKQAAENLIVLSRDEAGAERIFRENGMELLNYLLDSKDKELMLSALRTLSYLAEGHKSRTTVLLDNVTIKRIQNGIAHEDDSISTSATSLLQCIMDTYRAAHDKREHDRRNINANVVFDYHKLG